MPKRRGAAGSRIAVFQLGENDWPELRGRIATGATTILMPIGSTDQNGPHMVLGKHNGRARVLAGKIAQRLGNAVVAPVIAYVWQGSISPPAGHMRFPGTVSVPGAVFDSLLRLRRVASGSTLSRRGVSGRPRLSEE